jgi:hypothetical protein
VAEWPVNASPILAAAEQWRLPVGGIIAAVISRSPRILGVPGIPVVAAGCR